MAAVLTGCSSTKHVPSGSFLLDKVTISVDSGEVTASNFYNYLRQQPNHKALGLTKLQLGVYNLSGRDSTGRFNRWLRKIGEEPVIFDSALTDQSARQLRQALFNLGYHDAAVDYSVAERGDKKVGVTYNLHPGDPFVVNSMTFEFKEPGFEEIVMADSASLPVKAGGLLDLNMLDNQRTLIAEMMRENGYFAFTKENISFVADTVAGSKLVDLTMTVSNARPGAHGSQSAAGQGGGQSASALLSAAQRRYAFGHIVVVPDFTPGDDIQNFRFADRDTVECQGLEILYGSDRYLNPQALAEQIYIRPGGIYSTTGIERTYEALNRLAILRYVNILTRPAGTVGDLEILDVYVLLSRTKKMGITLELEGTNSEGDFGVGGGITYQNRNLAHRGEVFTFKLRGAYESLSGDFTDLVNNSYNEVAAEAGITFPRFMAPFLHQSFKHRMRASTEFAVTFMRQERPEYTRIIAGGAWRYKWATRNARTRRTLDLIDINVVNLPRSTYDFIDNIAPDNPLLRYSYEDHFIMRMGYTWYNTNRRVATSAFERQEFQTNVYTVRASVETAGAFLYAMSKMFNQRKDDEAYKIFGIQYAQFLKGEIDYTISHRFSERSSLAFHVGGGLAWPYGNSQMVPFEKRFYAGGANGVRGWNVRTLGPGSYDSRNSVSNFINQCGDISLILNLEFRTKLFWVFEGAVFADAGNIWTIKDYPNQEGGFFRFNKFYKEIAAAYGLGLRMDFKYFLLRLDMGVKAHNPARGQDRWPIFRPSWKDDVAFHFSVGYPF